MGFRSEFREFIDRGNVVDLAVGVVLGAAFGAVVKSLVDGVIMPPIGLLTGGMDFSNREFVIREEGGGKEAVAIRYGAFINTVVQFLIIAFAVFLLVRAVNRLRRVTHVEPEAPPPPENEKLLAEIRDLLKAGARGAAPDEPRPS
jgi:large conductance mechanosensitive channel